jgi:shikimate dehydrogenase
VTTHRLGLVGSGIDQSLSPAFHRLAGELLGVDVTYDLLPHHPAVDIDLDALLVRLGAAGYHGVNVTVPYKASAWKAAGEPSPDVVAIGVANTLLLGPTGPSHAFNTDFTGFTWAYTRRFGTEPPGTVAVLGAGGAGSAVAAALVDLGADGIRIFDIDRGRADALARRLRHRDGAVTVDAVPSAEVATRGADGLANCTPVGMHWHPGMPVGAAAVGVGRWVFDAVYSPVETALMARAAAAGLARLTGFDLFLGQALHAFEIFTGRAVGEALPRLEAAMTTLERERRL